MVAFAFNDFVFDDTRGLLTRSGRVVNINGAMLRCLEHMLKHPARLITKDELRNIVSAEHVVSDNLISHYFSKLRTILGGGQNDIILNVYGKGYRFTPIVTAHRDIDAVETSQSRIKNPRDERMVGRNAVAERLLAALKPVRSGRGGMNALIGEAGIGKTRVVEALARWAPQIGFQVSSSHCLPCENCQPLRPLLHLANTFGSEDLVGAISDAPEHLNAAQTFSTSEPTNSWHRKGQSLTDALTRQCASGPLLLIVEDLHWADSASLELLSLWVSNIRRMRLAIVVTVCDAGQWREHDRRRPLEYLLAHPECTRIPVGRLLRPHVEAYITELFGPHDEDLTDAVYEKSGGNPALISDLLEPFGKAAAPSSDQLKLSGAALEMVRQMMRPVSADARAVLRAAAVIGRSFTPGLLTKICGCPAEDILRHLDSARQQNIIAPRNGNTVFIFSSNVSRDVLYDEIPATTRAQLHLLVAEALALHADADAVVSKARAHHLLTALPAGSPASAIAAAQHAAHAAALAGDYADACAVLQLASEALRVCSEVSQQSHRALHSEIDQYKRAAGAPPGS